MTASAIVIGIGEYANADWNLDGPVADALRFASWAVREGGVEIGRLRLLLSPHEGHEVKLEDLGLKGVTPMRATSQEIDGVLYRAETETTDSSRLWFYYAGHGLASPGDGPDAGPLIVPAEADDIGKYLRRPINLEVFRGRMEDRAPHEQFYFIDACRDVVQLPGANQVTQRVLWNVSDVDHDELATQAILYATTAGARAKEVRGRGVFGSVLVGALRGLGPKLEEPSLDAPCYKLLFEPLAKFVKDTVRRVLAQDYEQKAIQVPDARVLHSSGDLVIQTFAVDKRPTAVITSVIEPVQAREHAQLQVLRWGKGAFVVSDDPEPAGPPVGPETQLQVAGGPRPFRVHAKGYADASFELCVYEDTSVPVELMPSVFNKGLESLDAIEALRLVGSIELRCNDRIARLEIRAADQVLASGTQSVRAELPAGSYRCAAILSASEMTEQVVALAAGAHQSVSLTIPPRCPSEPVRELLAQAQMNPQPDGGYQPSEALGIVTDASLGTILTYGLWAARWPNGPGSKLRSLGIDALTGIGLPCAIQVLVGDSFAEEEWLATVRVGIGLSRIGPIARLGVQYSQPVAPGNHEIRIGGVGTSEATYILKAVEGYVTALIITREADHRVEVQIQFAQLDPAQPVRPGVMLPALEDVRFATLGSRALASGDIALAPSELDRVLSASWLNPMIGVTTGYRVYGTSNAELFRGPPEAHKLSAGTLGPSPLWNLVSVLPELPDVHVLAAMYDQSRYGEHMRRADERGPCVYAGGYNRVQDWLNRRAVREQREPALLPFLLLAGSPWTAFVERAKPPAARTVDKHGRVRELASDDRMLETLLRPTQPTTRSRVEMRVAQLSSRDTTQSGPSRPILIGLGTISVDGKYDGPRIDRLSGAQLQDLETGATVEL